MTRLLKLISSGVLLCGATSPLRAQVQDTTRTDTIYRIGAITVQAARPVATAGGSSAIEVRLDSMRLPAAPSVEMVLREIPMVHVRTNSRGEAEISVRGSESRQVAVLVDGVPLTLGWDARTDVSVVPATAVQEVSLVRGLSSVLHGPNVLGGVVEMSIGQGHDFPDRSKYALAAGTDHLGGWRTSATASVPFSGAGGRWLVRAGAGFRDSPGAPLAKGVEEPVPTDDGLRLNTDAQAADGFLAVRYGSNAGPFVSLASSGFTAERGIAAELGAEEPRLWRYPRIWRTVAVLSGGSGFHDTPFGRGDVEASIGIDVGRTEIQSFGTRAYDEVVGTENGDDRTITTRLLFDHTLGARGDLRGAFTHAAIAHDAEVDGERAEYQQRLWSAGLETVWRLIDAPTDGFSSLVFSIGGAVDGASTPETGGLPALDPLTEWGARAGVTAAIASGRALLHAGASRRVRFPALREMYSEALNRFEPNPDLKPERLVAVEAGATTRLFAGEVQVVGFHHELTGAIRRITLETGKRQRVNADEIRSTGIEVLGSQRLGPFALGFDLTAQRVDLVDPNTALSSEPENLPELFGGAHARFMLPLDLDAIAEVRYTGKQFCQDPNTGADTELEAGTWLNAGVSRVFGIGTAARGPFSRLEARIAADNIADTALYDQCGLPQPGRLVRFEVRLF